MAFIIDEATHRLYSLPGDVVSHELAGALEIAPANWCKDIHESTDDAHIFISAELINDLGDRPSFPSVVLHRAGGGVIYAQHAKVYGECTFFYIHSHASHDTIWREVAIAHGRDVGLASFGLSRADVATIHAFGPPRDDDDDDMSTFGSTRPPPTVLRGARLVDLRDVHADARATLLNTPLSPFAYRSPREDTRELFVTERARRVGFGDRVAFYERRGDAMEEFETLRTLNWQNRIEDPQEFIQVAKRGIAALEAVCGARKTLRRTPPPKAENFRMQDLPDEIQEVIAAHHVRAAFADVDGCFADALCIRRTCRSMKSAFDERARRMLYNARGDFESFVSRGTLSPFINTVNLSAVAFRVFGLSAHAIMSLADDSERGIVLDYMKKRAKVTGRRAAIARARARLNSIHESEFRGARELELRAKLVV